MSILYPEPETIDSTEEMEIDFTPPTGQTGGKDWQDFVLPVKDQGMCVGGYIFTGVDTMISNQWIARSPDSPESVSYSQARDCTEYYYEGNYGCKGGDYQSIE